jgi:hypothetical protein
LKVKLAALAVIDLHLVSDVSFVLSSIRLGLFWVSILTAIALAISHVFLF